MSCTPLNDSPSRIVPSTSSRAPTCSSISRCPRVRNTSTNWPVARLRLVIGCPLGSEEHAASEARIANLLQVRYGLRLDFLEEHIQFGLPTEEQLRSLVAESAPGSKVEIWYHADFRKGEQMLLDGVAARWGHDPRGGPAGSSANLYLTGRCVTAVADHPTPTTNRIYAVVHLDPPDAIGTTDTSPQSRPTNDKARSYPV